MQAHALRDGAGPHARIAVAFAPYGWLIDGCWHAEFPQSGGGAELHLGHAVLDARLCIRLWNCHRVEVLEASTREGFDEELEARFMTTKGAHRQLAAWTRGRLR